MRALRYRHRTDCHEETYVQETRRESDGALLWGPVTSTGWFGSFLESFWDTTGQGRSVNYANHFKASAAISMPQAIRQNWGGPIGLYSTNGWPFFNRDEAYFQSLLPFVEDSLRSTLCQEALTSLTNQFEPQVDIVNFLFETSQIQDLIPKISSSISKTASGTFLGWKFGIKPMISDLKKLHELSNYVAKRLAWLRNSYGRRVRVGFSKNVSFDVSGNPTTLYQDGDVSGNKFWLRKLEHSLSFRAGGFLNHRLSGLDGIASEALALSAALGTQNPAAVLWEAIPFSFVADWFANIQGLVATLNVQPFKGEYKLEDVYHSYNTRVTYRFVQHRGWAYSGSEQNSDVDLGVVTAERYERFPGLPASGLILTDGSLSATQQLLALSLIRQRF